jgi:hypothetical protein
MAITIWHLALRHDNNPPNKKEKKEKLFFFLLYIILCVGRADAGKLNLMSGAADFEQRAVNKCKNDRNIKMMEPPPE